MKWTVTLLSIMFIVSLTQGGLAGDSVEYNENVKLIFSEKYPSLTVYINGTQETFLSYDELFLMNDIIEYPYSIYFANLRSQDWNMVRENTSFGYIVKYSSNIDVMGFDMNHFNTPTIKNWGMLKIIFHVENRLFNKYGKEINGSKAIVIDIEITPFKTLNKEKIVLISNFWLSGGEEYLISHNGFRMKLKKGELYECELGGDYLKLEGISNKISYGWSNKFSINSEVQSLQVYYSLASYPSMFFVYSYGNVYHDPEIYLPQSLFKFVEELEKEVVKNIEEYFEYFVTGMIVGIALIVSGGIILRKK